MKRQDSEVKGEEGNFGNGWVPKHKKEINLGGGHQGGANEDLCQSWKKKKRTTTNMATQINALEEEL